jgi:hypothetical protein
MSRPARDIHLICPPATGEATLIIREGGQRQVWTRVQLVSHQLDYYDLADLWPGWHCWHHEGRYLSDHTLRHLNWLMCPRHPQPGL